MHVFEPYFNDVAGEDRHLTYHILLLLLLYTAKSASLTYFDYFYIQNLNLLCKYIG